MIRNGGLLVRAAVSVMRNATLGRDHGSYCFSGTKALLSGHGSMAG